MTAPAIQGIHHLKFPVADLDRALAFYAAVFGASRIAEYDHRDGDGKLYAYILSVPNLGTALELRLNGKLASLHRGFDPITLSVGACADLQLWARRLDALGLRHSGVLVGAVGWLLVFEDPDGRRLRLYTREVHGPEETISTSREWLA
jgi:catechol 2,3-dioxygenase-like lactoylglutathione lyase family enzyme